MRDASFLSCCDNLFDFRRTSGRESDDNTCNRFFCRDFWKVFYSSQYIYAVNACVLFYVAVVQDSSNSEWVLCLFDATNKLFSSVSGADNDEARFIFVFARCFAKHFIIYAFCNTYSACSDKNKNIINNHNRTRQIEREVVRSSDKKQES